MQKKIFFCEHAEVTFKVDFKFVKINPYLPFALAEVLLLAYIFYELCIFHFYIMY